MRFRNIAIMWPFGSSCDELIEIVVNPQSRTFFFYGVVAGGDQKMVRNYWLTRQAAMCWSLWKKLRVSLDLTETRRYWCISFIILFTSSMWSGLFRFCTLSSVFVFPTLIQMKMEPKPRNDVKKYFTAGILGVGLFDVASFPLSCML